jgi:hypothetical protein
MGWTWGAGRRPRVVEEPGTPPRRFYEDTLRLALEEVQRARETARVTLDGMRQRAALLAGTSSIAGALSVNPSAPLSWIPVGLFAIAALAGIAVFWPTSGLMSKSDAVLSSVANYEAPQVLYMFVKVVVVETRALRATIKRQAVLARIGLVALAFGVLASIAVTVVTPPAIEMEPSNGPSTPAAGPR